MAMYQLLSGPERRRRWSEEQKRALVAAAFAPGAVVAEVAPRDDVCPGQIYR
jgi:transposase